MEEFFDVSEFPVNNHELITFTMTGAFDRVFGGMAYKLYEWIQTEAGTQTMSESRYVPH